MLYKKFELLDDAANAVDRIGMFTERKSADQVVADALRTYLWILREQTSGRRIFSMNGDERSVLADFVRDKKAAQEYFESLDKK